mgnify:CR=1 FL=1
MKLITVVILTVGVFCQALGQNKGDSGQSILDSTTVKYDTYEDVNDLERKKKELGLDQLTYIDSTFRYQVAIPEWFKIMETGTPYIFGGVLPEVKGIENTIAIKSFSKSGSTFEEFEEYVVTHMIFGQKVRWSDSHVSMGKNSTIEYNEIGKSYNVYLMQNKLMYYCQYVLIETETAYLWIDYTSTQETFDSNKGKFDEFMSGFEVLK